MATLTEVSNYISYIRIGIAEYTAKVSLQERLGKTNTFCNRQKVVLLSAYLDCIVDYFDTFVSSGGTVPYDEYNFFTTSEIRDVMQHINNICDTFYIVEL
jgi:hypothetical protein